MKFHDSDCLFDFSRKKARLNETFFPTHSRAVISRSSDAYVEFWNFLQRLQNLIRSRSVAPDTVRSVYTKHSKLNIRVKNYRIEDFLRHQDVEDRPGKPNHENIYAFAAIFDLYVDFLLKQKLARLQKLRRDQAALPIASFRYQLLSQLESHPVVVVAGDTGCGKSTQVPQYLHIGQTDPYLATQDSRGAVSGPQTGYQRIAVTQPRRIACISLAARVSTELLTERGSKVAYQVRFERSRTKATQILFLTEGLLLRQIQIDPFLKDYDVLVLDEVHERHWQTDCLLGLVKCLIKVRPELRVVLMSATINVNLFSRFFDNCPIIEVPGRLFPIDLKYVPLTPGETKEAGDRLDPAPYLRLLQHIDKHYSPTERGDLLVFLPGMADIQAVMQPAKTYAEQTKRWVILPLHSALSARDQEKVFHVAPDGVRKCVLSTNIAETSLTIDGIRFVVDSGRVKELNWDTSARMRCLKEFAISKASANQRKGRAGRTGPGVCFRLYTQEEYDALESYNTPEIRRVPLETLVLQMMVMGLPDVKRFPFIEAPTCKSLDEALERLRSHGALEPASIPKETTGSSSKSIADLTVTPLGQLLSSLPVDFSVGRMLIIASLLGLSESALTLAAGMAVQSPLTSTLFGDAEARRRLAEFESDHGEAFTLVALFDEWIRLKSAASYRLEPTSRLWHPHHSSRTADQDEPDVTVSPRTDVRRWCRQVGVEEQRLHEMVRLRSQFADLLRDARLSTAPPTDFDRQDAGSGSASTRKHSLLSLNRARRAERFQNKRKRFLTLHDSNMSGSDSGGEESLRAPLQTWLSAVGSGRQSTSVKDLELVFCYDLSSLASQATRRSAMTLADLVLLKVVLAGGLYPNVAIGDDANAFRVAHRGGVAGPGAEMVFHTKSKAFVTLHPNDVFVRNPDALLADCSDPSIREVNEPHAANGLPSAYKSNHQVLMYLDLMETTKPFLINTMRVPALPTLLLYCREVDTNADATRLVFDRWIEIRLSDAEAAQRALATVVWLRAALDYLMELKLSECAVHESRDDSRCQGEGPTEADGDGQRSGRCPSLRLRRLQRRLGHALTAFLVSSPGGLYTLRRLLAADVKQLHRRLASTREGEPGYDEKKERRETAAKDDATPQDTDHLVRVNRVKGGYIVTAYLTIDCLYPDKQEQESLSSAREHDSYNLATRLLHLSRQVLSPAADDEARAEETEPNGETRACSTSPGQGRGAVCCDRCGCAVALHQDVSKQTAMLRHQKTCTVGLEAPNAL